MRIAAGLLALGLSALPVTAHPMRDEMAVMDSLSSIHPRLRNRWLNERGIEMPGVNAPMSASGAFAESSGLHLVGKYGRGPSVEVTGRDSLVFLSLGSEVAILNFAEPDSPKVLAEVQAMGLVTQAALRDSFLYIGCKAGQAGIEVWNVQNPTAPVFRSRTPTLLNDFCVTDTFLYLTQSLSGVNDTFKVYSVANPENVYLLGSCRDSGDAVTVTNNTAFLADRWGLYAIDVSDPRNPRKVGTYPGVPISVEARNTICCVTFSNPNEPEWLEFDILDVSNPASMQRLGYLSDAGAYDIFLTDTLAFLSGYYTGGHGFRVLGISDSTQPRLLGGSGVLGAWGVWANTGTEMAYAADDNRGLVPTDIGNIGSPVFGSRVMPASASLDIAVDGHVAYVANRYAGTKLLDVLNPAFPVEVSHIDSGQIESRTVAARDSFAYVSWSPEVRALRTFDVSDPRSPRKAGATDILNPPQDFALQDSFLYIAENYKFEVVNVARPRSPTVVGTCNLPDYTYGMCLRETLAYVSTYPLSIVSVSNPALPRVIGSIARGTWSVFVQDSLAYLAAVGLHVWDVRNPVSPRVVDSLTFGRMVYDVVVVDTLAYLSCSDGLRRASVADIRNMRVLAFHSLPYTGGRLVWAEPYVYVTVRDAGICVFETTQTGISEVERSLKQKEGFSVTPNPVGRWLSLAVPNCASMQAVMYDAAGREVLRCRVSGQDVRSSTKLDLGGLSAGLYFLRLDLPGRRATAKVVKQ